MLLSHFVLVLFGLHLFSFLSLYGFHQQGITRLANRLTAGYLLSRTDGAGLQPLIADLIPVTAQDQLPVTVFLCVLHHTIGHGKNRRAVGLITQGIVKSVILIVRVIPDAIPINQVGTAGHVKTG